MRRRGGGRYIAVDIAKYLPFAHLLLQSLAFLASRVSVIPVVWYVGVLHNWLYRISGDAYLH